MHVHQPSSGGWEQCSGAWEQCSGAWEQCSGASEQSIGAGEQQRSGASEHRRGAPEQRSISAKQRSIVAAAHRRKGLRSGALERKVIVSGAEHRHFRHSLVLKYISLYFYLLISFLLHPSYTLLMPERYALIRHITFQCENIGVTQGRRGRERVSRGAKAASTSNARAQRPRAVSITTAASTYIHRRSKCMCTSQAAEHGSNGSGAWEQCSAAKHRSGAPEHPSRALEQGSSRGAEHDSEGLCSGGASEQ